MIFMWFGTAHGVTASNWNLLWAWPTHLVYAAVLARKGLSRDRVTYAVVTGVAMVLLAAIWEFVPQDLPGPALAVTIMLALRGTWTGVYARTKRASEIASAGPDA